MRLNTYAAAFLMAVLSCFVGQVRASDLLESEILETSEKSPADIVKLLKEASSEQIDKLSSDALIKSSFATAVSVELDLTLTLTNLLLTRSLSEGAPSLAGHAYYNRGAVYAYAGRQALALDAFLLSLASFETADNLKETTRVKGGLALMYVELGEYELAAPFFEEVIKFHRKENDQVNLAKVLQNHGFMKIKLESFDEAKINLIEALEISRRLDLSTNFPTLYKNLGKIETQLNNFDSARNYFRLSREASEAISLQHTQSETYREMANLAIRLNDFKQAKKWIDISIEVGKQFNLYTQLRNSYLVLAEIEAHNENYKAAYEAKQQSEKLAINTGDSRIAANLSRLERYTTRIKEQNKRIILEQEKKIATLAAERENLFKNLSIAIAIIAIFFAIYFIRRFIYSRNQAEMFEQQSKIDALTGVWNRRAGEAKLARLCTREANTVKVFSIAMLDIDHFKKVNDKFGHDIGDKVIIKICKLIEEKLRPTDMLCRWGGEEFVLILERFDSDKAEEVCERIRLAIETANIDPVGQLTVSIGVSMFENDELFELIKRGDQALYHAKHLGRNRVVVKKKPKEEKFAEKVALTLD